MLVDPDHPALEDAEKPFNRIGVRAAADIFTGAVLDGEVVFELFANRAVDGGLVGVQPGGRVDLHLEDRAQRGRIQRH